MSNFYQKIFAAAYDQFMAAPEKVLRKNREALITPLRGKILDVGVGTGVNFEFYHPSTTVIAVEPSASMLKKARPKVPKNANIEILNYGINDSALEGIITPNSIDAIICTLVLCTIPNPKQALNNFNHWLKPDGKLIVLEHIRSQQRINASLQDLINPAWKVIGDGCNLNRHTDKMILEAGFKMEDEHYFKGGIQWYQGVFTPRA